MWGWTEASGKKQRHGSTAFAIRGEMKETVIQFTAIDSRISAKSVRNLINIKCVCTHEESTKNQLNKKVYSKSF